MKKGAVFGYSLWWFLYMPMTILCVIAIVKIPEAMLNDKVQPVDLDAGMMQIRLFNKITAFSPVTGFQEGKLTADLRLASRLNFPEKKFGYKLSYVKDGKTIDFTGNKDFFAAALPLSPLVYKKYEAGKKMKIEGKEVDVNLVQVYPKEYET